MRVLSSVNEIIVDHILSMIIRSRYHCSLEALRAECTDIIEGVYEIKGIGSFNKYFFSLDEDYLKEAQVSAASEAAGTKSLRPS